MGMNLPRTVVEEPVVEEIVPDYLYERKDLPKLFHQNPTQRIFGVPGASLTWGINGLRHTDVITVGKEGEKATAKLLQQLTEQNNNVYVFHSLRWPTSNGDTDHILFYKGLIIVIDTKRWKGTRKYSITPKGTILRGTVAFNEGKVKIGYALKSWRKKLPTTTVQGIVTISQEKVFVVRDRNWYKAPYRLVEAEKLVEHVNDEIKKWEEKLVSGKVSSMSKEEQQYTLYQLASYLVEPRDPRKGLIHGSTENPFKK